MTASTISKRGCGWTARAEPIAAVAGAPRQLFLAMDGRALAASPVGDEAEPAGAAAWERLGELDLPVLVLVGAHDLPHVVERSGAVAAVIPRGRFEELATSAHLPQLDDPEPFNAEVTRFLDEH